MPIPFIFEPARDPMLTDAELEEQFAAMFPRWRAPHENAAAELSRRYSDQFSSDGTIARVDRSLTDRDPGDEC